MKNLLNNRTLMILSIVAACMLLPAIAFGGTTGGNEFGNFFNLVLGYASGYLGKGIALVAFVIGLGIGAARANPLPAVAGIVFAIFVAVGPGVIQGIASAVV